MRKILMGVAALGLITASPQTEAKPSVPSHPASVNLRRPPVEWGLASWYGEECQGNPTASGELYDCNGLTAAHRDLPLGTRIKVTNLRNSRSVILRVNDRGPNLANRLLDVSKAAAARLGFLRSGKTPVRVTVVSPSRSFARFVPLPANWACARAEARHPQARP